MIDVTAICRAARAASYELAGYTCEQKNAILRAISNALVKQGNISALKAANEQDVLLARKNGRDDTFIDRLTLNDARISTMIEGLNQIVALPDPVGEVTESYYVPSGLNITKVRAPLGVIGIIYEARPNVTVDAAALCLKSGNAIVLRGGSDAINSNRALYAVMRESILSLGLNADAVCFIDDTSRDSSALMLEQEGLIDVVIPRGGEGLKKFVLSHAKMPVIASAGGNCHIYVEKTANLECALNITVNAKVQRPSVCNAAEHLLVDREIAAEFLPSIYSALKSHQVEILGDKEVCAIIPVKEGTEDDFFTEFETYKMTFAVVDGVADAVARINKYGTKHSEAIITEDKATADYFFKHVDAAAIYQNASTRFTDGFEFGLGAEMGISTQKLHARGPVALKELTSTKYVIHGHGEIRA